MAGVGSNPKARRRRAGGPRLGASRPDQEGGARRLCPQPGQSKQRARRQTGLLVRPKLLVPQRDAVDVRFEVSDPREDPQRVELVGGGSTHPGDKSGRAPAREAGTRHHGAHSLTTKARRARATGGAGRGSYLLAPGDVELAAQLRVQLAVHIAQVGLRPKQQRLELVDGLRDVPNLRGTGRPRATARVRV